MGAGWASPEFVGAGGPSPDCVEAGRYELGTAKPILGRAGGICWKEPGTGGLCGCVSLAGICWKGVCSLYEVCTLSLWGEYRLRIPGG